MNIKSAAIVLVVMVAFGVGCRDEEVVAVDHPNLIYFFVVDALRHDVIGSHHNGRPVTPNLNQFARENVHFDHAYSQAPFTKISVSSLFTGLWPSRLGVKHCVLNVFPDGVELCRGLDFRFFTMAEYLASLNYRTYTNLFTAHVRKGDGLIQGFQYQEKRLPTTFPSYERAFVYNHVAGLHAPYRPSTEALNYLGPAHHTDPDPRESDWYWQPLTIEQGSQLHEYYLAEGYDWDTVFGELKRNLQKNDSWDNALVVVTADHGEEFLEHGGTQHSVQLYDEVLRVPLIIKFPENSEHSRHNGSRFSNRVRLVDVFPTLVHLFSQEEPRGFDGKSLIQILKGKEPETESRPVLAFTSVARRYEGDRVSFESWAVLSDHFKVITGYRVEDGQLSPDFDHRRGDPIRELFDLLKDPGELENIYAQNNDVVVALLEQYTRLSTMELPSVGTKPIVAIRDSHEKERLELEKQLKTLGYLQ